MSNLSKGSPFSKSQKKRIIALYILIFLCGCASSHQVSKNLIKKWTVFIPTEIPYSQNAVIPKAVADQCNLNLKLSEAIETASIVTGVNIIRDDKSFKSKKGIILDVEIIGVTSIRAGMSSSGFRNVLVSGKLIKDGKEIGNFTGLRHSSKIPFKRQCDLLVRCTEALGIDIIKWLENPQPNSRIGE